MCESGRVPRTVCVLLNKADRARLTEIVDDRSRPLKHVVRARIVLLSAERLLVLEVAQRAGSAARPYGAGSSALAKRASISVARQDATARHAAAHGQNHRRGPRAYLLRAAGEATHWTGRAVAEAAGISLSSVQRIWEAHRLQPHRVRTFKRSHDPAFAEKVEDMNPPAHAVLLSIDEKSQIQALERTRPALPLAEGHPAAQTYDYVRPRHHDAVCRSTF